jgi:uncharacterized peroxidase-related enzyme
MAKFPTLGDNATVPDILKMSPEAGAPLMEVHEAIMRGPSPLSPGERELIAAYVSGLNDCRYCHGVHAETAKAFAMPAAPIDRMFDDLEGAGFEAKMVPILRLAGKLTEKPSSVGADDAQAVYDAGWDEMALHHAILVTSLFNFMNRMLEGHGVYGHEALYKQRGPMLKEHGYLPLIRLLRRAGETAA